MAERCAYKIIEKDEAFAKEFAQSILDVKRNVKLCAKCGNFCEGELCRICETRKSDVICVVKDPRDIISLEKSGAFSGTYHVLHGVISPLDKKGPNDINLKSLVLRVRDEKIREVIIATNPDVEGEATASYIASLLKPAGVLVTRLATGLSLGTNLEYADGITLGVAITNRVEI
jgi:recombination protein RecR